MKNPYLLIVVNEDQTVKVTRGSDKSNCIKKYLQYPIDDPIIGSMKQPELIRRLESWCDRTESKHEFQVLNLDELTISRIF
tara:strand:+ start:75404 stop:75646 length:243 start_codon:yes stop_codon:yes gene_type:complete